MSNSNVPEHATRTRRVSADLIHGNRPAIVREDATQSAFTPPPAKKPAAPSISTVQIVDPKTLAAQKNERDLSQAIKVSGKEMLARIAAKEQAEKEARKAASKATRNAKSLTEAGQIKPEASQSGKGLSVAPLPKAKTLPAYQIQFTDGSVSGTTSVDPEIMGFLPAIRLIAADLADRVSNFRALHGVFLVTYTRYQDGPSVFTKVEVAYYHKAGAAHTAGEKALSEGAERFTVSHRLTRSELLQSERGPERDPFKRLPNVWMNRQHKQTWGWGETRCTQSKVSFSHG